jgi:hypothetical protein
LNRQHVHSISGSAAQYSAVFYFADEYKFLCENMASSSKKGLGIRDISNLLDSNEIIDKLIDSDTYLLHGAESFLRS